MSSLILNAEPILLDRDQRATMSSAPATHLLLSFENSSISYNAAGSYSQGGEQVKFVNLKVGQTIPSSRIIMGTGSDFTFGNASTNPNALIRGGLYGMGKPTKGIIQLGKVSDKLGQFESVLGETRPAWLKYRLTTQTDLETVVYAFFESDPPQGVVLNYMGSGDTTFKTTTGNQFEQVGNWGGNPLFFVNVSSSSDCTVTVEVVNL